MVEPVEATADSRQQRVLIAYTALWLLSENPGLPGADRGLNCGVAGRLVVTAGFREAEAEVALGATLAGAAFLGVESDPEAIKRAMRAGCCDFMVNNLDEALRILKNEVRKRQPVSIGLRMKSAEAFAEMVERGVLPDVVAEAPALVAEEQEPLAECVASMRRMGAISVGFGPEGRGEALVQAGDLVQGWSSREGLRMMVWNGDAAFVKRLDAAALTGLPAEDRMRRRWLELAPKYFRRDLPLARAMWMAEDERTRLDGELQ